MFSLLFARRAALALLPAAYLLLVAAEFLALTHITLALTGQGRGALAVGLVVAAFWVGIVAATSTAHVMVRRWGTARLVPVACGLEALLMVGMALTPAYEVWLLGLLATGFLGGVLWVCCEAWMVELAPPGQQGLCIGIFETGVGLGMMAGPAVLVWVLPLGVSPLAWASVMLVCSTALFVPLRLLAGKKAPSRLEGAGCIPLQDARPTMALLGPLAVMGALGGLLESGFTGLLPSLALRLDFSVSGAAWLGALVGAGSALLQTPSGMACDRWGCARSMRVAWSVLLVTNLALWFWGPAFPWLLWLTGFVLGGVGGAVYTLVVVEMGRRLEGAALVRGMSWMVTAYALGTIAGPLLGGWAFDQSGLSGAALLLVVLSVLGGVLCAWHKRPLLTAVPAA